MELFVSANDAKLVRQGGGDVFPADAGPDTLSLVDIDDAHMLATVVVQNSIVGPPQAVALSPDGGLAVVAAPSSYDRDAETLRFATVLQVVHLDAQPTTVDRIEIGAHPQSVAFTPDGTRLLATTVTGELLLFSVAGSDVTLRQRLRLSDGSLSGLGVLADGSAAIVSLRNEQGAAVIDLTGPEAVALPDRLTTGVSPYAVDTDASGRWAVIGSVGWAGKAHEGGRSVADVDLVTLVDTASRPFRSVDHAAVASIPEGVAISPDGAWVVALCMAGTQLPPDSPGSSPSGRLVLFANDRGSLRRVDALPTGAAAQGVVFSRDSRRIVAQLYADRCLGIYQIASGRLTDTGVRIPVPGGPASLRRGF
ncbi:hypothetical protein [Micropruina sp.]|uniref:hypothetical protein n=1 Tax=Micropruina sp. TaxID=2737536 RepID=UPI0039E4DD24